MRTKSPRKLRVHFLQHVAFEGPAAIAEWMSARGHRLTSTHFYRGDRLPAVGSVDWLVVMGGPMNVYEHRFHPWLREEKRFLADAIAAKKTVLGVCLGAQLIADVLGGKVYQNMDKEIGWMPVRFRGEKATEVFFRGTPRKMTVFHWHGDTFDLPPKATLLASSPACVNQAFAFGERVVGLQFHLETTLESVAALVRHCGKELTRGRYIQTAKQIIRHSENFAANREALWGLLRGLETKTIGRGR